MPSSKKVLFFSLPDCSHCGTARAITSEVAQQFGVKIEDRSALSGPKNVEMAPAVCIINEKGDVVKCIQGFIDKPTFRQEVGRLISTYV